MLDLAKYVDHTILAPDCDWSQVKDILDTAIKFGAASACIPPSFVKQAKEHVGKALPICTVIGFPLGYSTTKTKLFEARDAIENGADELDMVINIGWLKSGQFDLVQGEIESLKEVCGARVLKVIVETSFLTKEEIVKMCHIVTSAKADFIKTSTGFSSSGAKVEDITLMAGSVGSGVGIKASGGISTIEQAKEFVGLGATRLGSSRILGLLETT